MALDTAEDSALIEKPTLLPSYAPLQVMGQDCEGDFEVFFAVKRKPTDHILALPLFLSVSEIVNKIVVIDHFGSKFLIVRIFFNTSSPHYSSNSQWQVQYIIKAKFPKDIIYVIQRMPSFTPQP